MEITLDRVRHVLSYCPDSGDFHWKNPTSKTFKSGQKAGFTNTEGYIGIGIDKKIYLAHRLAWFYFYGTWPQGVIDHKDQCRSNNKIQNLRDVSIRENCQNSKLLNGYTYSPNNVKKWRVRIRINGKKTDIGYFETESEARSAYLEAKAKYQKGFIP